MNAINYFKNSLSFGMLEIKNLYQYRPPIYDIAIGIFRPIVMVAGSLAVMYSTQDHKSVTSLSEENIITAETADIITSIFITSVFTISALIASIPGVSILAYLEISSLVRWSKANKISADQSKKDVVLVCNAKSDWTGAANNLTAQNLKILKKLAETHSITFAKIGTIVDINDAIEQIHQQGRKIKTLWLLAHGNPHLIHIGKEIIIGNDFAHTLFDTILNFFFDRKCVSKIHFEKLDSYANIVLSSCSVGDKSDIVDSLNIAEWFQLYAGPHRRVFAPLGLLPINGTRQTVNSNGEVNYHFKSLFGSDITSDISYSEIVEKINKKNSIFMGG